jgi:NAD(P)H-nitrite reductase large subunit
MRVCHCRSVTDREIVSLVREDVTDVDAIGEFCGAGTGCGGCRPEVERIISIARSEQHAAKPNATNQTKPVRESASA